MTARLGGPVTPEERALGLVLAAALVDPERPTLGPDDVPTQITYDAAYGLGMHLARIVSAQPPPPSTDAAAKALVETIADALDDEETTFNVSSYSDDVETFVARQPLEPLLDRIVAAVRDAGWTKTR